MRDKAFKVQQKRVAALIDQWTSPLGFGWQQLTFRWYDEPIPDYPQAVMTCAPQWEYHEALICVDLTRVEDLDDVILERTVVHELMHVLLAGMWQMRNCEDDRARRLVEEHTATTLAKTMIWARTAGRDDAKRAAKAAKKVA